MSFFIAPLWRNFITDSSTFSCNHYSLLSAASAVKNFFMPAKFVLIGSGLAGGLLAAYLGRRGYDVDLYERRADPREGNMVGGRSINLALSTRGIHALQQIGIADEVLKHAIPMRGRMIHEKSGGLHFAPYDVDPNKHINSIGRAALNTTVIEAAQRYPNVRVHFNHKCTDVDLDSATAQLLNTSTTPVRLGPQ